MPTILRVCNLAYTPQLGWEAVQYALQTDIGRTAAIITTTATTRNGNTLYKGVQELEISYRGGGESPCCR